GFIKAKECNAHMFGENLKTLRKQKGFSQEELAARLHVVRQTISKWEKNLSVPDADTLIRLAEILEVSVSELLGTKIESENVASDVAEQLSRINEQLAIKNRRSRRIWKVVAIVLAIIVLVNIFIAVFFRVPDLNGNIQNSQPAINEETQIIEE
ncbi:MAG: helix-turn-helix domain-containing protein, partial [bacterium]|nr:helix-turn-helix domain-containing protein [bacterium]